MSGLRARGTRQRGVSLRGLRDLHLSDLLVSRGGALHRLCGQAPGGRLNRAHDSAGAVGVAAVTPLLADPTVRSEQLSQLLLGETAELLAAEGDWRRLRATHDGYEGWAHHGYLRELDAAALELWPGPGWSYGAELDAAGVRVQLPLRARVGLAAGGFVLPDGRTGQLVSGRIAARGMGGALLHGRTVPVGRGHALGSGLLRPGADHVRGARRRRSARRARPGAARRHRSPRPGPSRRPPLLPERDRRPNHARGVSVVG